MTLSRHNIIGKLQGTDGSFIINPLARSADLLDPVTAREIEQGTFSDEAELVTRGYLVEPAEEIRLYRSAYLEFLDRRDASEVQLFFAPWYACNFACPYCYQEGYSREGEMLSKEVTDAFFDYIGREFAGRRSYVTLFGGEPLLPGKGARQSIEHFLARASLQGQSVAVVTNGYTLSEYLETLSGAPIREIQVTLDGVGAVHDRRRPLRGGGPTFERIVEGIDRAVEHGFPVNLRVVLDRDNIDSLPELARFAGERGWLGSSKFKTQLGRNYELHTCQAEPGQAVQQGRAVPEDIRHGPRASRGSGVSQARVLPCTVPLGGWRASRSAFRCLSGMQERVGFRLYRPDLLLHCNGRERRRGARDFLPGSRTEYRRDR